MHIDYFCNLYFILEPPVFIQLAADRNVKIGESITLDCQAVGNPDPWIEWYKDSEDIKESDQYGKK